VRIVLLTTDTPHHVHFARQVAERFPLCAILTETRSAAAPFDTFHPLEAEREAFERETLLRGPGDVLQAVAPVHEVGTVNDPEGLDLLAREEPDVVLVFGTGILHENVIRMPSVACLNLHGGDPERYRGLDSHLWAIYHRDFPGLVTALHHVDVGIDTGDLVATLPLPIGRSTRIHELRALTTRVCVDLVLDALDQIEETGSTARLPQREKGRYYSFMPAVLKDACVANLARHVAAL
jgi:methionyl-tRNA formyltransferase